MNYFINMVAKPFNVLTSQITYKSPEKVVRVLLINSFVSMMSAKKYNKDINLVVFVNFHLDSYFSNLFYSNKIKVIMLDYDDKFINSRSKWSIVNYRFNVIKYVTENFDLNDKIILCDTDTITISGFDDIFKESELSLLLFDTNHSLSNRDRNSIIQNYVKIFGKYPNNLTHYGGEFISGKVSAIKDFYIEILNVISTSNTFTSLVNWNDEHINSIALYNSKKIEFNNANAYIYRYWTNKKFYLISSNYYFNNVAILHLPNEKSRAIISIFLYYLLHKKLPNNSKLFKILNLVIENKRMKINSIFYFFIVKIYLKFKL